MARTVDITIDYDRLTERDWADAAAIAGAGGVALAAVPLRAARHDPALLPVPALAALIYVALRADHPRITADRCVRLAMAVANGG